jgi:hypothetical protein
MPHSVRFSRRTLSSRSSVFLPAPQAAFALTAGLSRSSAVLSYRRPAPFVYFRPALPPRFLSGVGVIRIFQGLEDRTTAQKDGRKGGRKRAGWMQRTGRIWGRKCGDRRTESVTWIRSRRCCGRVPESGSECVRPVLSEVSTMGCDGCASGPMTMRVGGRFGRVGRMDFGPVDGARR